MRCSHCDADIPADSRFCIECGQPVAEAATGTTQRLPGSGPQCAACGAVNPAYAAFCALCGQPLQRAAASGRYGVGGAGRLGLIAAGLVLVIGLIVLARFRLWWPGVLVVAGAAALVGSLIANRLWIGLQAALWLGGLAVLARFRFWWPGMIVLLGLIILMNIVRRPVIRFR